MFETIDIDSNDFRFECARDRQDEHFGTPESETAMLPPIIAWVRTLPLLKYTDLMLRPCFSEIFSRSMTRRRSVLMPEPL